MLDPAGPLAREVTQLWWGFFGVAAGVYLLVIAFLVAAALRRRGAAGEAEGSERRLRTAVALAVAATVVTLFVLAGSSFSVGRRISSPPGGGEPVRIRVVGHQWWWDLRYEAELPSETFTTANEMHVPVGRPIELKLGSADVIHSFWVPSLQGKRDLIPGHTTNLVLRADRAGEYRGQCAEFCGTQHAHMALLVVAEPEEKYAAWVARQRSTAATPANPKEQRGLEVFLQNRCPACHRLSGTVAGALVAPDLTHVASRRTLAAGTLPNTKEHRAAWIADPQQSKPGVRMPKNELPPPDLDALLAYLGRLE